MLPPVFGPRLRTLIRVLALVLPIAGMLIPTLVRMWVRPTTSHRPASPLGCRARLTGPPPYLPVVAGVISYKFLDWWQWGLGWLLAFPCRRRRRSTTQLSGSDPDEGALLSDPSRIIPHWLFLPGKRGGKEPARKFWKLRGEARRVDRALKREAKKEAPCSPSVCMSKGSFQKKKRSSGSNPKDFSLSDPFPLASSKALQAVLFSSLPQALATTVVRRTHRAARRCCNRGEDIELALKTLSSSCRQRWLTGCPIDPSPFRFLRLTLMRNDSLCGQFSFVRRALSPSSSEEISKALAQHKVDLTTPFVTDLRICERARKFACWWANRRVSPGFKHSVPFFPSKSSCIGKTRKEGGLNAWISENLFCAEPVEADLAGRIPAEDSEFLSWTLGLHLYARKSVSLMDGPPKAAIAALREPGRKVRVVTKSPPELVYSGHPIREKLLSGLRRDPQVKHYLSNDMEGGLSRHIGSEGVILSSDLRAASDLIPHDLTSSIIDGLEDSGRFAPWEIITLRVLSGPQEIIYPGGETAVSCRGLLMGLPTTWGLLNIAHLFAFNEARRSVWENSRHSAKVACFSCFGDDALLSGHPDVALAYNRALEGIGAELSAGKHASSQIGRGVFLERLVSFTGDRVPAHEIPVRWGGRTSQVVGIGNRSVTGVTRPLRIPRPLWPTHAMRVRSFAVLDFAPLRGLVSVAEEAHLHLQGRKRASGFPKGASSEGRPGPPRLMPRKPGPPSLVSMTSGWSRICTVVDGLRGRVPHRTLYRIQERLFPGLRRRLQSIGLHPLPRCLGGSGLLSRHSDSSPMAQFVPPMIRKSLAGLLTNWSKRADHTIFSSVWDYAASSLPWAMLEEAEELPSKCEYEPFDENRPLPEGALAVPGLKGAVISRLSAISFAFGLSDSRKVRARDIPKMVSKRFTALGSRWKSASPFNGSVERALALFNMYPYRGNYFHRGYREPLYSGEGPRNLLYPSFTCKTSHQLREFATHAMWGVQESRA